MGKRKRYRAVASSADDQSTSSANHDAESCKEGMGASTLTDEQETVIRDLITMGVEPVKAEAVVVELSITGAASLEECLDRLEAKEKQESTSRRGDIISVDADAEVEVVNSRALPSSSASQQTEAHSVPLTSVMADLKRLGFAVARVRQAVYTLSNSGVKTPSVEACLDWLTGQDEQDDVVLVRSVACETDNTTAAAAQGLKDEQIAVVATLMDMGVEGRKARGTVLALSREQSEGDGPLTVEACIDRLLEEEKEAPCLEEEVVEVAEGGVDAKQASMSGVHAAVVAALLKMGVEEKDARAAVVKLSHKRPQDAPPPSVEACLDLLERVGKGEGSLNAGEDDGEEEVQRRLKLVAKIVDMGFSLDSATMATKRSLSLNECVQWVLSNGDEGGAMAVRSRTGLRVIYELEDEPLRMFELGIEGPPLIKHVLKPRREIDLSDPLDLHFRCLEAQIRRLTYHSGTSLSFEVEYVINPVLIKRFRAREEEFKAQYGESSRESKSILAFHGTKLQNVKSIITNNFDLTKVASNTGNTGYYGRGIYFSEFPDTSRGYGEGLLLCRVLTGRSFVLNNLRLGCALEPGYDSHMAGRDQEERGQELVIFETDQILPCYVITFKGAKRYDQA